MTISLSPSPVHPLPHVTTFAVVALSAMLTLALSAMLTLKVSRILHLPYARRAGNILQAKKCGNRANKDD